MGEIPLVDLYWTSAGPVEVHAGREWSTFEWRERCAHAQRVGFQGLGLWHADVEHQLERRSLKEIHQIFEDAGLSYLEVEFLQDFWVDRNDPRRTESDRRRRLLFDVAAEFDAHHIKVGNIPGTPAELERVTEAFGELCQDAAENTDARIVYEFMPFDVNVDSLEKALALVTGAAQPNGALALDTWHMAKLAIMPADLREIPSDYLGWVELSDGQFQNMDDPVEETVNHRRLPGEGEFDIPGYVDECRAMGYEGPWGVEVLSEELRNLPIAEEFDRAYETTLAQFGASVASGDSDD